MACDVCGGWCGRAEQASMESRPAAPSGTENTSGTTPAARLGLCHEWDFSTRCNAARPGQSGLRRAEPSRSLCPGLMNVSPSGSAGGGCDGGPKGRADLAGGAAPGTGGTQGRHATWLCDAWRHTTAAMPPGLATRGWHLQAGRRRSRRNACGCACHTPTSQSLWVAPRAAMPPGLATHGGTRRPPCHPPTRLCADAGSSPGPPHPTGSAWPARA
jgi:hypothetical protein